MSARATTTNPREVDPRDATIIADFQGDEVWLYERGNLLGVGVIPKATTAAGFAVLLDGTKVDLLIEALQARRARMA
jgi:hypothetical protein